MNPIQEVALRQLQHEMVESGFDFVGSGPVHPHKPHTAYAATFRPPDRTAADDEDVTRYVLPNGRVV